MREFLARYLIRWSVACYRRPRISLCLLSLSFLFCLAYGGVNLKLQLAWTYLFHSGDPVVKTFLEARDEFPYPGDIAVLVDHGSVAQRERFIDLVAAEMAKEPEIYHHVFYRVDLKVLGTRALYFLDEELLAALHGAVGSTAVLNRGGMVSETAVKIQLKLLSDLKKALLTRGRSTLDPVWRVFAKDGSDRLTTTLTRLFDGERYVYSTLAGDQVHVLLFKGGTRGADLASSGREVAAVRELLERLGPAAYGLRVRVIGVPVMLYDERQTCAQDSVRSGAISFLLILLVFALGFGGLRKPLYCLLALGCGLGWTTAYAALTVGHLNFITVTLVSMLMGLGIDFGIHLLYRFQEECESEPGQEQALVRPISSTGVDTLVGAVATSAAFFALSANDFRGVSDLGVLAGGGVLLSLRNRPFVAKYSRYYSKMSNSGGPKCPSQSVNGVSGWTSRGTSTKFLRVPS